MNDEQVSQLARFLMPGNYTTAEHAHIVQTRDPADQLRAALRANDLSPDPEDWLDPQGLGRAIIEKLTAWRGSA